ncbi:MAG: thioredoxin domain-containing protein [Deltaproteobacteria bacterium]|nr:thioredoxin domain-containing protein [Deltaproteobacteria bacterium]
MNNKKRVLLFIMALTVLVMGCGPKKQDAAKGDEATAKAEKALDIDLYIMSQCPYGVQAMQAMTPVVEKFKGQVGLNVDFIGNKKPDGTLGSMHGEKEVQGDIDQLCAKEISHDAFLKFAECVNKTSREIPANSEACAKEAGIDAAKFKACSTGDQGKKLLSASFDNSQKKGATGSPTIFIGGESYKGGRSQQAIEQFICQKYGESKKLDYCKNMEPAKEVKLTVITDKRCGAKCDPARMIESLKSIFMGLKADIKDWNDPGVQDIAKAAGITKLPALFFDKTVEEDKAGYEHMNRWLTKTGDYYIVKVRADFDPNAEICDNKKDDTGNGKVDCDDETCANTLACRPETPKKLEVFVMSECPFGKMAVNAMPEVLEAFKGDMDFEVNIIASQSGDNVTSMHGPSEVEEDIRWLCAKKYYAANNKYMDYLTCRSSAAKTDDWKACATGPIKAAVIEKCATGDEGKALIVENIKIANGLGIGASPTWLVNGKTQFSGVTPKAVQDNFCKANAGLKGCETPLSDDRKTKAPAGSCGG